MPEGLRRRLTLSAAVALTFWFFFCLVSFAGVKDLGPGIWQKGDSEAQGA